MFADTLISTGPEFRGQRGIQACLTETVAFMEQKVGRDNIVHMDEKMP